MASDLTTPQQPDAVEQVEVDESVQPFEISLYLPARPLLPKSHAANGLPDTPNPLKVAVTPQETLNDLRVTITDSPEGYWLGAFCFRKLLDPSASNDDDAANAKLGKKVGEWVELREVFNNVPKDQRKLYITHVAFNEADARSHVQRLRDLLTGGQADPTAIGIDAGFSVQDAVRNPSAWSVETAVAKKPKAPDAASPSSDLPFTEWNGWQSTTTSSLIPVPARKPRTLPTCLRHLSLAAWNSPPQHLKLQGHLLYLQIGTLEGESVFVTCSTHGFYVNRSTGSKFDPSPRANGHEYASLSLFDLLGGLSPLFLSNFAKLFNDPVSARDYFSAVPVTNSIPAHPWLARIHDHQPDHLRSQTAYLLTGATSVDTLEGTRDWNDELQSTRELPRTNLPERLMRDRVLNRIFAEFTQAAARAVPRVAAGEVQAMNPMDKKDAQMFIVNNLFISKSADGVDIYPHMGGDEAAHVAVGKDVQGIKTLNSLDIDGLCLLGTVVIDWKGERWVAQSIVPGLFRRRDDDEDNDNSSKDDAVKDDDKKKDSADADKQASVATKPTDTVKQDANEDTQVVYGGVEGPEVIRKDATFHKLFSQVAQTLHLNEHEVEDAKGNKHSLWLSVDSKGLRGADGRKYVLDLARLNPVDISWLEKDMNGPILETNQTQAEVAPEYPHRMTLLRPELLEIFWDSEFRKWAREKLAARQEAKAEKKAADGAETSEAESKQEKEPKDSEKAEKEEKQQDKDTQEKEVEKIDSSEFKLSFNPDAFAEFKISNDSMEQGSKVITPITDESDDSVAAVRRAAEFLRETAIPRFVTDVAAGLFSAADGGALSRQMHARGINIRYLGYVAQHCEPQLREKLDQDLIKKAGPGHEGFLRAFRSVALQEMVLRASKRILRSLLAEVEHVEIGGCVSHLLNCLLGTGVEAHPKPVYQAWPFADDKEPVWTKLTPQSLVERIRGEIRKRFRYELPETFFETELRKPQLLREIALRCGVQLKLQDYKFTTEQASLANGNGAAASSDDSHEENSSQDNGNGKAKKKKGNSNGNGNTHANNNNNGKHQATKKANGDVVRKSKRTTTFEPEDVVNLLPIVKDSTPKSTLAEEAFEAGRISVSRGDRELGVELLMEGVSFHEQVYGLVHPEVARCYAIFATILHHFAGIAAMEQAEKLRQAQANGEEDAQIETEPINEYLTLANAVRYQRQAVTVSERTLGLDHPETLNQYMNLAVLERSEGNMETSLLCQQRVLELWEIIYGQDHPDCVNALSNIGFTLQNSRRFDASLKLFQEAHQLALSIFGPDSIHTGNIAHELSQALTLTGDLKTALTIEKEAWRVFEERLGKDDAQTKESEAFCLSLTASAVRVAKLEKEASARDPRPEGFRLPAAARPATTASTTVPGGVATDSQQSERSLDEIVKYIQGGANASPLRGKNKSKPGMKRRK